MTGKIAILLCTIITLLIASKAISSSPLVSSIHANYSQEVLDKRIHSTLDNLRERNPGDYINQTISYTKALREILRDPEEYDWNSSYDAKNPAMMAVVNPRVSTSTLGRRGSVSSASRADLNQDIFQMEGILAEKEGYKESSVKKLDYRNHPMVYKLAVGIPVPAPTAATAAPKPWLSSSAAAEIAMKRVVPLATATMPSRAASVVSSVQGLTSTVVLGGLGNVPLLSLIHI